MMEAGSRQAIAYAWWKFVDELLHAVEWLEEFEWRRRFCEWTHRKDAIEPLTHDDV